MPAALYADEGDHAWVQRLQFFAVADGYQPVTGTMQDIGMAVHTLYPFIGTQVITKYIFNRQNGQETFNGLFKAEVRGVQDQVAWLVIAGKLAGKSAAQASSVNDEVMLGEFCEQVIVNKLHIGDHVFLIPLAGAFAETPVIHQHHIIIIAVKIPGIFCPALYAAAVAVKIKDESQRVLHFKMQPVDTYPRLHIKEQFFKRCIVFVNKILFQFLRLEDQLLLQKVCKQGKHHDAADDIECKLKQGSVFGLMFEV